LSTRQAYRDRSAISCHAWIGVSPVFFVFLEMRGDWQRIGQLRKSRYETARLKIFNATVDARWHADNEEPVTRRSMAWQK